MLDERLVELEDLRRRLTFAEACGASLEHEALLSQLGGLLFQWAQPDVVTLTLPATGGHRPVLFCSRQPILPLAEESVQAHLAELHERQGWDEPLQYRPVAEMMALHAVLRDAPLYQMWSCPLGEDGEHGLLTLFGYNDWILSRRLKALLRDLGPLAARAVERCSMVARLRAATVEDELTGALNRRGINDALARELARAQRGSRELSLLLIDLDHFKRINDTFGHAQGDAVLRAVAKVLTQELRRTDLVGRLGGDEFVVLLPELGAAVAEQVGQRLVNAARACWVGDGVTVSLSVGVATFKGEGRGQSLSQAAEGLLARADEALYDAKRAGRGRISQAM